MPGKLPALDTDYIIKEYLSGRTGHDIARELRVPKPRVYALLRKTGVTRSNRDAQKLAAPNNPGNRTKMTQAEIDDILARYKAGESMLTIAASARFSSEPIYRLLQRHGLVRSVKAASAMRWQDPAQHDAVSAQMYKRWANMTKEQRKKMTDPAHEAVRGRRASFDELCLRATTREATQSHASDMERQLSELLVERGLAVAHQTAVGPYNCDLTTGTIAVEVFGGGWHWSGHHLARTEERFRYILNAGWHILAVAADNRRWPLSPAVADYLVTEIQRLGSDPATPREYRMIWRAGEFTTGGCVDDDHISIEPPFSSRRNPVTGQYETAPR